MRVLHALGAAAALCAVPLHAADEPGAAPGDKAAESIVDVTALDIDQLLELKVTSAAKKAQPLTAVPAAIYVIRGDDLRRTGVTSIAEALRAVPGLQVAQSNAHTWAISSRGFNDIFANKLLVLIDGRTVYSPIHSGVFWDVQDTLLEDVDRIEVIRGPGGSLWGANAINGIINIITKQAADSQGGLVTGGAGTEERGFAAARHGFKISEKLHARVYGKFFARDDARSGLDDDDAANDEWSMARGGLRSDWLPTADDRIAFIGEFYHGTVEERITLPSLASPTGARTFFSHADLEGGSFLSRWTRQLGPTSDLMAQAYYDYTYRSGRGFTDTLHTGDVDFQHRFRLLDAQEVVWGLGYRLYRSEFDGDFAFQIDPKRHTDDVLSAFLQDEVTVVPDRLRLTIGTKVEYNDYSGLEVQPSGRLAWNVAERHMIWGAVSRAVRTPSLVDVDTRLTPVVVPGPVPIVFSIFGRDSFRSEQLIAYEGGYRVRPVDNVSIDIAGFYNRYDRLRSGEPGTPFVETTPPPTHIVIPVNLENDLEAETWGVEAATNVQLAAWWLLQANYAYLRMNVSEESAKDRDPEHSVWVRSAMDLPWGFNFDAVGRYVSKLDAFDVPGYFEADLRLGWASRENGFEAAVVGQNLLHESHPEFQVESQRSELQRGVYFNLSWRF